MKFASHSSTEWLACVRVFTLQCEEHAGKKQPKAASNLKPKSSLPRVALWSLLDKGE